MNNLFLRQTKMKTKTRPVKNSFKDCPKCWRVKKCIQQSWNWSCSIKIGVFINKKLNYKQRSDLEGQDSKKKKVLQCCQISVKFLDPWYLSNDKTYNSTNLTTKGVKLHFKIDKNNMTPRFNLYSYISVPKTYEGVSWPQEINVDKDLKNKHVRYLIT